MGLHRFTLKALALMGSLLTASAGFAADLGAPPPPPPAPAVMPGWTFTVIPYAWLPSIKTKVNLPLPGGGSISQTSTMGPGELLSDLKFGFMGAAEADYQRFVLLTDLFYGNLGVNGSASKFGEISRPDGRFSIPASANLQLGMGLGTLIWTTAAGYEIASGPWGDAKAFAGFRLLNMQNNTWYQLNAAILGPRGGLEFAKGGDLQANQTFIDGIVGVEGRFNIPNSNFFIPYYGDVGTGNMPLTWQAFSGIGYKYNGVDLSFGYRYLSFENNSNKVVESLNLGGVIATAMFKF